MWPTGPAERRRVPARAGVAASAVDATLYPLFNTIGTVVIKPTSGSPSATNPSYTGTFVISQYSPFASSIGDIATFDVTWPSAGSVVRGTA